jgi:hypothetical protein
MKVGDRVKVVRDTMFSDDPVVFSFIGHTGKITNILDMNNLSITVYFDDDLQGDRLYGHSYFNPEELEVVE